MTKLYTAAFALIRFLLSYYSDRPHLHDQDFPALDAPRIERICVMLHSDKNPDFPISSWANAAVMHFKAQVLPEFYFDYTILRERRDGLLTAIVSLSFLASHTHLSQAEKIKTAIDNYVWTRFWRNECDLIGLRAFLDHSEIIPTCMILLGVF